MKKKAMTEYKRAQVRKEDVACAGRIFNENGGVLVWEMMLRIRRETHSPGGRPPPTQGGRSTKL